MPIPFNLSNYSDESIEHIKSSLSSGHTSGDGKFTKKCQELIEKETQTKLALVTHSCSAALEMSAILINAGPGDEIIMPSYTFVTTASSFVLRGATPVFVDIRTDNCNINEKLIEAAITPETKAIVVVHYAGVACDMGAIMNLAKKYKLFVIEDAAQAYGSFYKNKPLGSIGDLGTLSFHETKNISSGEGGALLINNESMIERAHMIREKGTDRTKFVNGQVDKYSWVDIGSSYLPSDIISAYLYSNLKISHKIREKRVSLWNKYYEALKNFEDKITLPVINDYAFNNGHMFYVKFKNQTTRDQFIHYMKSEDITSPFHYLPLHSSKSGKKYCKIQGNMTVTNETSNNLVRLPIFYDLTEQQITRVINLSTDFLKRL